MEEFSRTSKAINEYIITSDLPAFQVIQHLKTLPDFLMFPVFLALRHQHHSTYALPANFLLPDKEIIHVMNAFDSFANVALERSRTASDALKYACHNWTGHLSRAPEPWDSMLHRILQAFWNDYIVSWLEMEWCLKGLPSCFDILSEGQKLAKFEPVNAQPNKGPLTINPDPHSSATDPSALASASEMSTRGPSTLATMFLTEDLVAVSHARPVPTPRLPTQTPPSTSSLALPLPPSPSPRPNAAALLIGASQKRLLNRFQVDSDSQLESDTPSPSKRRK
ncbi:hypothetical protein BDR04DRAFT_22379 [Suillus decipiens]|nr:hypothetical protein BDR04DRAFT_22379 [Suillus decipiens]